MTTSPEPLSTAVKAITSAQARQHPIVMMTRPEHARPEVCVPDWGELRVIDDRRLRVAVWPSDPTAVNLDHDAPTLLIVTAPTGVHLIHATARRLPNAAMVWAHYELTITSAHVADRGTAPQARAGHAKTEVLTQRPPKVTEQPWRHRREHKPPSAFTSAVVMD
ncbi:hypothetical protein SMC26_21430 [Actinomadura fulvescens]|uniref:Pyridoxamine 5'-phosphate oxidase putative domain-containing protein n=1 Tax=Actinomadura fulvescens TaxID=46160 RepID=A0ABN3QPZ4_9ACTN